MLEYHGDRYRFRRRDRSATRSQAKWSTLLHLRALGRGDPPRQAALEPAEPAEPPRDVTSKSPIDCKQCSKSQGLATFSVIFKVRGQRKQSFCMITKATPRHMQGYKCPPVRNKASNLVQPIGGAIQHPEAN